MIDHLQLLLCRHFKRLRKLSPAAKVCEAAERSAFWSCHTAGSPACSSGSGPHQSQAEASAWTDRHGRGGKHDRHHHGKRGRKCDHGHGRRGRWGWLAEASAAAGGHRVMTYLFNHMQLLCLKFPLWCFDGTDCARIPNCRQLDGHRSASNQTHRRCLDIAA